MTDQHAYRRMKPRADEQADWRRPVERYFKGSVTPEEQAKLVETLREAVWLRENPFFIEIGVFKARGSKMMLQVLGDEMRQCHVINTDISKDALRNWRRRMGVAEYQNVKRDYVGGGLKAVVERFKFEPESVSWIFVDGCHCFECCHGDLILAKTLVHPGGFLIVHDTDPRHDQGPKDQNYHGKPGRAFGVQKALKEARLEEDYMLQDDIPGLPGRLRPIRAGMRVYRRLEEQPSVPDDATDSCP